MCMCVCVCGACVFLEVLCVGVCVCTSMEQGKGGYVFAGCRQLWSGAWRILLHMFWEHFTQPQNLISGPHKPGTQQQGILYFFSLSLSLFFFFLRDRATSHFSTFSYAFAIDTSTSLPSGTEGPPETFSMASQHSTGTCIKAARHSWHLLFAFSPRSEFKNNKRSLSFFTCVPRTLREGICPTLRWEKERGMEREIDT